MLPDDSAQEPAPDEARAESSPSESPHMPAGSPFASVGMPNLPTGLPDLAGGIPDLAGGMPDLQALLSQASAMQEQLVAAQHELEEARIEGTAGGGLVHATVTGTGELIGLTIDPSVCDPDDPETLADLVLAAVQNAVDTAHRRAATAMGDISGGLAGAFGASGGTAAADEGSEDDDELW